MGDTALNSYPIGGGKIIPVDHTGPKSYTTGGETLGTTNNMTGISVVGLGSLDMVLGSGSLTDSGTYYVFVQPSEREAGRRSSCSGTRQWRAAEHSPALRQPDRNQLRSDDHHFKRRRHDCAMVWRRARSRK